MKAIYAGSFSPPTNGHMDIIARASEVFDELIVAVLSQTAKQYLFSVEMREAMLKKVTADMKMCAWFPERVCWWICCAEKVRM